MNAKIKQLLVEQLLNADPNLGEAVKALVAGKKQIEDAAQQVGAQTDLRSYTVKELQDLGLIGLKHDPAGPAATPVHGPGGIFSEGGVRPAMYSAMQQPVSFMGLLPLVRSDVLNELTSIMTGMTEDTGENPDNFCGNPITPGKLKKCTVVNRFGKMFVGSDKVEVPLIGARDTYADVDRTIQNWSPSDPFLPDILRKRGINFRSQLAQQLFQMGVAAGRAVAYVEVDGDITLTGANRARGWIAEPDGLSKKIKDGYADTGGNLCPAADSLVVTWNAAVTGTVGGRTMAELLYDVVFSREMVAGDVGMAGTGWAFVGPRSLFRELVFVLARSYANIRFNDGTDGNPINRNAEQLEARVIEMTRNQALMINGVMYPYIFTSDAEIDYSSTPLEASLFFVPMVWMGNPLIYNEYFPMNNQFITEFNGFANTTNRQVLNNGLYMTAVRSNGLCDEIIAASLLRMKLETPFLAARIDQIQFSHVLGYRTWDPSNSTYFYNGGTTYFNSPASQL